MTWDEKAAESWNFDLEGDQWRGHFVYVAWGKTQRGRPLYVGRSSALRQRIGFHTARAPWAGEVRSFTFHRFLTAVDAARAEQAAIRALDPKFNESRPRYYGEMPEYEAIEPEQRAIVARVQGRGRAGAWGDPE